MVSSSLIFSVQLFGWGTEDVEVQISTMAAEGIEATYCMGDDAPLAALSALPHTLYDYFKQRFAQVTNPPIDPLREGAVMSLAMFLGPRGNPLSPDTQSTTRVKINSPILNSEELKAVSAITGISMTSLSVLYPLHDAVTLGGLKAKINQLCDQAIAAVKAGANVLNLSDRLSDDSSSWKDLSYVPPLLAVGAVHHSLIRAGLRPQVSIVVTTGQAWATHHFACLVGYGASAVVPYAAFDAVINWHGQKRHQLAMQRGDLPKLTTEQALANFRKAIDKGLLKVLSKMGISLLTSYHGAQIFEALGLSDDVVLEAFKGTSCRVGGMSYDDIAAECADFSRRTFGDAQFENLALQVEKVDTGGRAKLFNYGFLNYFKSGEYHHNNQPLVKTLHSAIRNHDLNLYQLYEESVTSRPPTTLRDVMQFTDPIKSGRQPVPLEEVESAESIMKRFATGGMSLGALSREAHETLAIAMNRMGARSNSGEGGEDPQRFAPIEDVNAEGRSFTFPHLKGLQAGDIASSKIKQVASGRFGVTPQYLMSAEQLEIKIAQVHYYPATCLWFCSVWLTLLLCCRVPSLAKVVSYLVQRLTVTSLHCARASLV
jgi:glutamate synthase (ferredoxin)